MNEDTGHDQTVPTPPVEPTEPNLPATSAETTATEEQVAAVESEGSAGQAPPNLPPRAAASEPIRRRSIAVPMWAALALAALIVLGVGFLGGYAVGSEEGHGEGRRSAQEGTSESDTSAPSDGSGQQGSLPTLPPRPLVPPTLAPRRGNGGQGPSRPQPATPTGAFLGVSVRDSADPLGATVIQVGPAGPAGVAGLKAKDVITAVDGTPIKSAAALTGSVRSQKPGTKIVVTYTRAGASATADVTLGDRAQLRAQ